MGISKRLKKRNVATDVAIVGAVALFFIAGVYFESRRSSGRLPEIVPEVGAQPVPTSTVVSEDTSKPTAAAPTSTPAPTPVPMTPTPVPAGTPNPDAVGRQVFLDVEGIENESVVEGPGVTLTGMTTPDALVSVNGQPADVDLDGSFTFALALDPGPNFIELVSSNLRGQESSRVFSVVSVQ